MAEMKSVRITKVDRLRLKRLQATVTKRRGAKISQKDVLHELVDLGRSNFNELLRMLGT